jgi:hypothetical protein
LTSFSLMSLSTSAAVVIGILLSKTWTRKGALQYEPERL